jgi:4-alpha-glucanotransferase
MSDLGAWGVDAGYWDTSGRWHDTPEPSMRAIAEAVGVDGPVPPLGPPMWFVRAGRLEYLQGACDLVLEDGTELPSTDVLPPDVPIGYHRLVPLDGGPVTQLVVTPGRCHLPPALRTWGWAVQLYAARSRASWGIGDLADLRRIAEWSASRGAGVLAVSPLHAPAPVAEQQPSPYYASSRRFRNPLHLRIEEVPGATERLGVLGRALNDDPHIDRDRVWVLKLEALEAAFAVTQPTPSDDPSLRQWATYCAIAEVHGDDWRRWPPALRHPNGADVRRLAAERADRVAFHAWLQELLDAQLARAARSGVALVHDLAVGFDSGGADAWAFQDQLALDARVGAPPDDFNEEGQDWGLPPFVPWKLRAAGYAPFIDTVRSAFAHAGGVRVDHVMGLFRLFWVPRGAGPTAGTYVRYPAGELLDILAVESERAGAFVVGEDLGTVEDGVRSELSERHVLSYRLLWFEDGPPETWPGQSVAAVTTHDLPTVAGVWTGADPHAADFADQRTKLEHLGGLPGDAPAEDAVAAAHTVLARAHSKVLLATLEDACASADRPNLPGTTNATNWSTALPLTIDELEEAPLPKAIGEALRRRS